MNEPRMKLKAKGGLTIELVTQEDQGLYTCSASNILATVNSTGKLFVYDQTEIVEFTQTQNQIYMAGDLVLLSCKATFDRKLPLKWTWKLNGKKLKFGSGGNSGFDVQGATLEFQASADKAGEYECIASTSVSSDEAKMIVHIQDVPS